MLPRSLHLALPPLLLAFAIWALALAGPASASEGDHPRPTPAEVATPDTNGPAAPAAEEEEAELDRSTIHPSSPMKLGHRATRLSIPLDLSGYFWVDSGYMMRKNARAGQYDQDAMYMQGRFVLAADYYREWGDFYATARAEFIGFVNEFTKSQYEAHILDAYVQLGTKHWDVQIGRFLAWEVYYRGAGIELFTAEETGALGGPSLYWLQTVRGHRNESGQAALHFYPTDFLGIEIAGIYGQEQNQNNLGIRPSIDFRWEGLRVMAGYEYLDLAPQISADKVSFTQSGWAARLEYELPKLLRVGANVAQSTTEAIRIDGLPDADRSADTTSVGGYVDLDFWLSSLGLGYHYTAQTNKEGEDTSHHQAFVSYLVRLPLDGVSLKAVYGYALASIFDIDINSRWENEMHSFRLRVAYDFR